MTENPNINPYSTPGSQPTDPQQITGQQDIQPTEQMHASQQTMGQQSVQPTEPMATSQSSHAYNQSYAYNIGSAASTQQPSGSAFTQQSTGAASTQQSSPYVSTFQTQSAGGYAPPSGSPVTTHVPGAVPVTSSPRQASHATSAAAKGSSGGKTFLIAFAGALVACVLAIGVGLGFGIIGSGGVKSNVTLGASNSPSITTVSEEASLAESVANKCLPSVVSIDVYGQQQSGNSIYDYLYGLNNNNNSDELSQISLGSGIILSDDGYIITNNHVIESGSQFKVTIEGSTYDAELIGSDSSSDVAVLKVKDGAGFTPIELGDSDNITIGEWVMSIGSPFGLEQSVATGIVSATSRSQIMDSNTDLYGNSSGTTIYPNMIQTDAAINPGNSGGALVNSAGALIGINTLITSYSGNYSGVGFAIPSNYAISIAQSIISGEEPTYAQLGITMTTINSSVAERYGFTADEGAYISSIISGSAAEKAGLKVGDIIVAFDGETVASASDVMLDVRVKKPGDKVTVTVDRAGERLDVEVTLGEGQASSSTQEENN